MGACAESKVPVSEHTLFRGFSMTKSVTAVAALILMDRGSLKLSDPVAKYIPSFADVSVIRPDFEGDPTAMRGDSKKTEPVKR